jgi:hypothetical protein
MLFPSRHEWLITILETSVSSVPSRFPTGPNDRSTMIGPARIGEFPRTDVSKNLLNRLGEVMNVLIAVAQLGSAAFFERIRATALRFPVALLEFIADGTQAA